MDINPLLLLSELLSKKALPLWKDERSSSVPNGGMQQSNPNADFALTYLTML